MESEWQKYAISDVMYIIGGGTPKRSISEYWNGDIPWLSVADFNTDDRHVSKTKETITDLGLQKSSTKLLDSGQLIISARGTVGALAQLDKPMTFNQSCYGLNAKTEYVTNDYLYYLVKKKVRDLQKITHGAVFDTITKDTFKDIEVQLPSLLTQKKIANILSTLDDKIELNRRMNETLEGMAQALFKRWFVDFDPVLDKAMDAGNPIPEPFQKRAAARKQLGNKRKLLPAHIAKHFPDSFVFDEEMGWIPEEWEKKQVKDFGSIICGKTPSKSIKNYYGDAIPFIKIPDMHNSVWITNTSDGLSLVGARSQAKKQIPENSICVSCIATIGKVVITSEDSHTNQQINSVVPHRKAFKYFLYFAFLNMNKFLHDMASGGSATLNLNTGNFSKIEILSPSYSVANAYYNSVDPLFQKMLANDVESKSLTNLRDALLPKLLSGELRVPDVEKLIEKAL